MHCDNHIVISTLLIRDLQLQQLKLPSNYLLNVKRKRSKIDYEPTLGYYSHSTMLNYTKRLQYNLYRKPCDVNESDL